MGDRTKIDWCDASWNPVTGCLHGCQYCYAKRIAERFGLKYAPKLGDSGMEGACKYDTEELGQDTMLELEKPYVDRDGVKSPYPMAFLPTFHKYRLGIPQSWKQPKTIFVCSMADLFGDWVPDEWIERVFQACIEAPQHHYFFLTKNPKRYERLHEAGKLSIEGLNGLRSAWFGTSVTKAGDPIFFGDSSVRTFLSIEPIHGSFKDAGDITSVDWAIIGAETGSKKEKIVPEKKWVTEIAERCHSWDIAVFMKESLRGIMGEDFIQEFPKYVNMWRKLERERTGHYGNVRNDESIVPDVRSGE